MWPIVILVLLAVNLWTFAQFGFDKRCAVAGRRRTPERDLLTLAAMGGSPAAFAARKVFRHKTRKEPFSTNLALIATMQVGAIAGWWMF